jgi:hypothetical protein
LLNLSVLEVTADPQRWLEGGQYGAPPLPREATAMVDQPNRDNVAVLEGSCRVDDRGLKCDWMNEQDPRIFHRDMSLGALRRELPNPAAIEAAWQNRTHNDDARRLDSSAERHFRMRGGDLNGHSALVGELATDAQLATRAPDSSLLEFDVGGGGLCD